MTKKWRVAKMSGSLLDTLLARRGLSTPAAIEKFLEPNYERDLADPFLLNDMELAVRRILLAIKKNEKIAVFADYDADGVPGAALLASFFKKINFSNFLVYIPDRHEEVFGLNQKAIKQLKDDGVSLIVTVDCGSTDAAEVEEANRLGLEVIITDHHLLPPELPPALAIINPKFPASVYPDPMLCGTGVAFKLVQALIQKGNFSLPPGWEKWLLDLVAIATVADMVPLRAENRALVHFGLRVLRQTPRPGLLHLARATGIKLPYASEEDIAFTLGPRLNAASRMAHALEAYELLTTADPARAGALAARLVTLNHERRQTVEVIIKSAEGLAADRRSAAPLLVLGHPDWSLGVLGLAAARLAETYEQPVFVWAENGHGLIKGSCRSDGSINVVDLMQAAGGKVFFDDFGGHALAGGFSLKRERVGELESRLTSALNILPREKVEEEMVADAALDLAEVNDETYRLIEKCAPFGIGNPKPLFLLPNLTLGDVKLFGGEKNHLELILPISAGRSISAIGFFMNLDNFPAVHLTAGEKVDLLAHLERSHFKSRPELRLRLVDIRQAN